MFLILCVRGSRHKAQGSREKQTILDLPLRPAPCALSLILTYYFEQKEYF